MAAQPFAATAWSFLTLLEAEEFDDLRTDANDLRAANRVAIAFHEPKKLGDEHRSLTQRMKSLATVSIADAKKRGLEMVRRIRQGKVLDGD